MFFSSRALKIGFVSAFLAVAVLLGLENALAQPFRTLAPPPPSLPFAFRANFPTGIVTGPLNAVQPPPVQINSAIQGQWVLTPGASASVTTTGTSNNQMTNVMASSGAFPAGPFATWALVPAGGLGSSGGGFGGGAGIGGGIGGFGGGIQGGFGGG